MKKMVTPQMLFVLRLLLTRALNIKELPGNVLCIHQHKTHYGWGLYPVISFGIHSYEPNVELLFLDRWWNVHYNKIGVERGLDIAHPINYFMCSCFECHPPGIEVLYSGLHFAVSKLGKVSRRYFGSFLSKEKPA